MLDQETFQIRRPLPPLIRRALAEREINEEDIVVATDTDLDIAGEYSERWVVVTKELVLVFLIEEDEEDALVAREVRIDQIQTARTDSRVGSGFLEAKMADDVFEELVRFSNKNADKFAKVAAKIKSLAEGKQVEVEPEEEVVGRCQKCGMPLADKHATVCPRCVKRGLVFLRFLKLTKPYWPLAACAMGLVILTILIQLVPAQLIRVLLDNVFGDEKLPRWFEFVTSRLALTTKFEWLGVLVGSLALTTLVGAIIFWLRETLAVWVAYRLGFDLRREVFRKLEDMAVRYHDSHPVGQLMTRCSQDIETLQGFMTQLTTGFGYQIIMVTSVAAVMFAMNVKLALWAIAPAPVVMGLTVWYYRRIVPRWRKYWTSRSNLANMLNGTLYGIRVVKAFAQEEREARHFETYSARFRDAGHNVGFATARFYPLISLLFQFGSYFIWMMGGIAILDPGGASNLTVGTLIAFLSYLAMFYTPLNALTQMSTWFTSFTTQAHRVFPACLLLLRCSLYMTICGYNHSASYVSVVFYLTPWFRLAFLVDRVYYYVSGFLISQHSTSAVASGGHRQSLR